MNLPLLYVVQDPYVRYSSIDPTQETQNMLPCIIKVQLL